MDKLRMTLLISAGMFLILTTSNLLPLSIFQWNKPLLHYGDITIIRRDVFDTVTILSLSAFLAAFILVIVRRKKGEDI